MRKTHNNISLARFENEVVETFGQEGLSKRKYSEEGKPMTLYYFNNYHIGTHQKRSGWMRTDIKQVKIDAAKQAEQFASLND